MEEPQNEPLYISVHLNLSDLEIVRGRLVDLNLPIRAIGESYGHCCIHSAGTEQQAAEILAWDEVSSVRTTPAEEFRQRVLSQYSDLIAKFKNKEEA